MSAREWKPGDVALVNGRACINVGDVWEHGDPLAFGYAHDPSLDIRPLVLLDPENPEHIERLTRLWEEADDNVKPGPVPLTIRQMRMQVAVRRFDLADPKPRIEEPTGLGAVVEDADGKRWVCTGDVDSGGSWWMSGSEPERWPNLNVVRVLHKGVTS